MSRTPRCFETELPKLYRESKYCDDIGFIRYSVPAPLRPDGHQDTEKLMHEEEAAVWLWHLAAAWPSQPALPGWPCPIEWIFTLVNGNYPWPGDLWGVDERGELVIVEGKKQGKTGDRHDPFEDFVRPPFLPPDLCRPQFTAEELRREWQNHLHAELDNRWPNSHEERPNDTAGILPRSSGRAAARRWTRLTEETRWRLESKERSEGVSTYSERVNSYLEKRKRSKNPKPHFAGLILRRDDRPPSLSVKGKENEKRLVERVGRDHVHLFLAYAKRVAESTAQCSIERIAEGERG